MRYFEIDGKQCRALPFDMQILGSNREKLYPQNVFVKFPKESQIGNVKLHEIFEKYGEIKSVQVLPFEGASEVPDSIDTEAHVHIAKQFKKELKQIRDKAYAIQRAYITYLIEHSISSPKLTSKTVTLSELISLNQGYNIFYYPKLYKTLDYSKCLQNM
jgi:hypothetical protein